MDTLELTPKGVRAWKKPPFQRDLRINERVRQLVEDIRRDGGVVPGTITLGRLDGDIYLVDGQHRAEAFLLSEMPAGYADVRICTFETMADMSEEFVRLNSSLVRMRNDDIIRGLEAVTPELAAIRRKCPFIGYSNIRNGQGSRTMLSMAVAIRGWFGSAGAIPTNGPSSTDAVKMLDDDNAAKICRFQVACFEAWGVDRQNYRLWSSLNLGVLAWLYRRVVLGEGVDKNLRRSTAITPEQFGKCLMALSADPKYTEWLIGRSMGERDRGPCYARIKDVFARRLAMDGIKGARFPQGEWQ
jgi:hypothetical protein